jgi:cobalt-zinc-cadmium efflux system protein
MNPSGNRADHDHGPGPGDHPGTGEGTHDYRPSLRLGVIVTLVFFAVEVAGGYLSGSLSLLSDAGHMFIDAFSLILALVAIQVARSLPTKERTYGLHRAGIFAAFVNAILLIGISGLILYEAYSRILSPRPVEGGIMLFIACVGLAANVVIAYLLHGSHDLNIRGAFLHVMADALSSIAVIAAALWIMITGQTIVDPLLSGMIAVVIVVSAAGILRETVMILLQFTPRDVDFDEVIREMESVPGVAGVHDVHIWSLSSHIYVLDAHVYSCESDVKRIEGVKQEIKQRLGHFRIFHTTLEFECEECRDAGLAACSLVPGDASGKNPGKQNS